MNLYRIRYSYLVQDKPGIGTADIEAEDMLGAVREMQLRLDTHKMNVGAAHHIISALFVQAHTGGQNG